METMTTERGMELFGTVSEIKALLPQVAEALEHEMLRLQGRPQADEFAPCGARFRTFEGPLLICHDHLIEWGYDSQVRWAMDGDEPEILFSRDSGR